METPVMTKQEVAEYLKISIGTLNHKIKEGKIPHFKIGSQVRFNKEAVEAWKIKIN